MTSPRIARLELELDVETEPIAGRLRGDDGDTEPFSGWLDLTRAIELRIERARGAVPPPRPLSDRRS